MNPKVNFYFEKADKWSGEIAELRTIILDCGLDEVLKWGNPCYLYEKDNIVLIHTFKEYCALLFFKGVLLQDEDKVLIQQTENVQAPRQMRFTSLDEIKLLKDTITRYVFEAIEIEKAGLKVALKKTTEYEIPEEFATKLETVKGLKKAFESLTPGRQRAYLMHFSQPKQSKTREARVEKHLDAILDGRGLND